MGTFRFIFLSIFALYTYANSVEIRDDIKFLEILPHAKIHIDKSRKLTIEEILRNDIEFQNNDKNLLGYGFSPDFDVWIRFSLTNKTDKTFNKILEYNNPISTHLSFYDPDRAYLAQKDGLFSINKNRSTINPIFEIQLAPNQTKTYYLKASSYITTLIIQLRLWDYQSFYEKEIKHQIALALFFGAMLILGFYNLFIYFFTKDVSYLFYFLYLLGVIIHHTIYRGIGITYLLDQGWIIKSIVYASVISSFPIFVLALFTKSFLRTKQYPYLNKILNFFIVFLPISVFVFVLTDEYNKYRNIPGVSLLAFLLFITIYATFKRNRQAYFILAGWCAIFLAILFMQLSSTGVFDIYQHFPYFIESALVFEAMIFSIALADRIKQLQADKELANKKLIQQQENEKIKLSTLVEERTDSLKIALKEKELLLKELNHRVKNNMQMIVSLIRLQKDDIKDLNLKEVLTTTQNRISTMKHLHELLYKQNQLSFLDTPAYFELLLEEIKQSYQDENISIQMNIQAQLQIEQAIYCGIILNELITNAFKYAFPHKKGTITIELFISEEGVYTLLVSDDGIGYTPTKTKNSLGLTLVNALAKSQLKGNLVVDSQDGVHVRIQWSKKNL